MRLFNSFLVRDTVFDSHDHTLRHEVPPRGHERIAGNSSLMEEELMHSAMKTYFISASYFAFHRSSCLTRFLRSRSRGR